MLNDPQERAHKEKPYAERKATAGSSPYLCFPAFLAFFLRFLAS